MSPRKKVKKQYTDEYRAKTVKKLVADKKKDPQLTIKARAQKLNILPTVLRNWVINPRYNEEPSLFSPQKVLDRLPTNSKRTGPTRAKPLVATKFECPHCGGAITPS